MNLLQQIINKSFETIDEGHQNWFDRGSEIDIKSTYAVDYIEDDEWDYEWRLCMVPASEVEPNLLDPEESNNRIADIKKWAGNDLIDKLKAAPPIMILPTKEILDGNHRTAYAKQSGLKLIPMLVGRPVAVQVNEEWFKTIKIAYANGLEVDVFKNPSRQEFSRLIKQHKQLRGILDSEGNLLVWDAYLATHGDIEVHIDGIGAYLYLMPDRLWFNDMNFYYSGLDHPRFSKTVKKMYVYAKNNTSLNRIYGRDFVPLGIDNETRERFDITHEWIEQNVEQ